MKTRKKIKKWREFGGCYLVKHTTWIERSLRFVGLLPANSGFIMSLYSPERICVLDHQKDIVPLNDGVLNNVWWMYTDRKTGDKMVFSLVEKSSMTIPGTLLFGCTTYIIPQQFGQYSGNVFVPFHQELTYGLYSLSLGQCIGPLSLEKRFHRILQNMPFLVYVSDMDDREYSYFDLVHDSWLSVGDCMILSDPKFAYDDIWILSCTVSVCLTQCIIWDRTAQKVLFQKDPAYAQNLMYLGRKTFLFSTQLITFSFVLERDQKRVVWTCDTDWKWVSPKTSHIDGLVSYEIENHVYFANVFTGETSSSPVMV